LKVEFSALIFWPFTFSGNADHLLFTEAEVKLKTLSSYKSMILSCWWCIEILTKCLYWRSYFCHVSIVVFERIKVLMLCSKFSSLWADCSKTHTNLVRLRIFFYQDYCCYHKLWLLIFDFPSRQGRKTKALNLKLKTIWINTIWAFHIDLMMFWRLLFYNNLPLWSHLVHDFAVH
jgi:hypothetical protein